MKSKKLEVYTVSTGFAGAIRMTPEQIVDVEINRFSAAMNLSESQKVHLTKYLNGEYAELLDFMRKNPGISRDDLLQRLDIILSTCRDQLNAYLNPAQLAAWDVEMERAKQLLGDELAA
jgi:hypothetical protein